MAKTKTVRVSMQWARERSFLITVPNNMDEHTIKSMIFAREEEFRELEEFDEYPVSFEYEYSEDPNVIDISVTEMCSDKEVFPSYLTHVEEVTNG